MNDNDEDPAFMEAMAERGTLLTADEVEASIHLVEAMISQAICEGHPDSEDDQNAIVAEATFRWLEQRMGGSAVVGSMMQTIASGRASRSPEPPEAA
jgi:hypothetical protein